MDFRMCLYGSDKLSFLDLGFHSAGCSYSATNFFEHTKGSKGNTLASSSTMQRTTNVRVGDVDIKHKLFNNVEASNICRETPLSPCLEGEDNIYTRTTEKSSGKLETRYLSFRTTCPKSVETFVAVMSIRHAICVCVSPFCFPLCHVLYNNSKASPIIIRI